LHDPCRKTDFKGEAFESMPDSREKLSYQ